MYYSFYILRNATIVTELTPMLYSLARETLKSGVVYSIVTTFHSSGRIAQVNHAASTLTSLKTPSAVNVSMSGQCVQTASLWVGTQVIKKMTD